MGFIAEDVPELVAVNGRDALSALEIAALLTKVVQEQAKTLQAKEEKIKSLERRLERLEKILAVTTFENKIESTETLSAR